MTVSSFNPSSARPRTSRNWQTILRGSIRSYNLTTVNEPLGLIAGEGVFPLLVARGARAAGRRVVCAGIAGCAWPQLRDECAIFKRVGVTRVGQWIRVLKNSGCNEAI